MTTWVALLRGINVGGHHIVPMKDLRAILADLGYRDAKTYIQSGNCVFRSDESAAGAIADAIATAIDGRFGFKPAVFVLAAEDLDAAIAGNPYDPGSDLKSVHLMFLARPAIDTDLDALAALRAGREDFTLTGTVFYLFAPDGIGRSKLAEKLDRHIRVPMTGRNLRSVLKIAELVRAVDGAAG